MKSDENDIRAANVITKKINTIAQEYETTDMFCGISQYLGILCAVHEHIDGEAKLEKFLSLLEKSVILEHEIAKRRLESVSNSGTAQRYTM